MPRSHGVLKVSVWEVQSDFRTLPLDAQWAYAMLISQPQINNCGVLPFTPEKWWRFAPDLGVDRLGHALDLLEEHRYTVTDADTGELLVRTFVKHDKVWKQPRLVTNARKIIREIESPAIRDYLTGRHPWLTDDTWTLKRIEQHETSRKTLRADTETPSETPRETPPETPLAEGVENEEQKGVSEGVSPLRAHARDGLPLPQDQPPSLDPLLTTTAAAATHAPAPATDNAAAALIEKLDDLGLNGTARRLALEEPDRAQAWIELASREAQSNPAGFILTGLKSREWPSRRGPVARRTTATPPCSECGTGGGMHAAGCSVAISVAVKKNEGSE